MTEKYRPSNGTEGHCFIDAFCCRCARSEHLRPGARDDDPAGCPILDLTFALNVEDPDYPTEWISDESGPRCTAYVPEGQPLATPRCTQTADMFGPEQQE
jgi:hypothetical protein